MQLGISAMIWWNWEKRRSLWFVQEWNPFWTFQKRWKFWFEIFFQIRSNYLLKMGFSQIFVQIAENFDENLIGNTRRSCGFVWSKRISWIFRSQFRMRFAVRNFECRRSSGNYGWRIEFEIWIWSKRGLEEISGQRGWSWGEGKSLVTNWIPNLNLNLIQAWTRGNFWPGGLKLGEWGGSWGGISRKKIFRGEKNCRWPKFDELIESF